VPRWCGHNALVELAPLRSAGTPGGPHLVAYCALPILVGLAKDVAAQTLVLQSHEALCARRVLDLQQPCCGAVLQQLRELGNVAGFNGRGQRREDLEEQGLVLLIHGLLDDLALGPDIAPFKEALETTVEGTDPMHRRAHGRGRESLMQALAKVAEQTAFKQSEDNIEHVRVQVLLELHDGDRVSIAPSSSR
jgi:hypothetical protein